MPLTTVQELLDLKAAAEEAAFLATERLLQQVRDAGGDIDAMDKAVRTGVPGFLFLYNEQLMIEMARRGLIDPKAAAEAVRRAPRG